MIKKVITGALVLVVLGASQTTTYATYKSFPSYIYSMNANASPIEIISPKEDIVVSDKLLISVKVFDNASVTLRIYREDAEKLENILIFGPDKVDQGQNLNFYNKELKDLSIGKYRMVFDVADKNGNKKDPVIKYFTVKNKELEINQSLENIPKINFKEIINGILDPNKK